MQDNSCKHPRNCARTGALPRLILPCLMLRWLTLPLVAGPAVGCDRKDPQDGAVERYREQLDDRDDDDDDDDDDAGVTFKRDPESACARLTERTRACDLLGADEDRPCVEPWDSYSLCLSQCSLEASCDDLSSWICEQVPLTELPSIEDCVDACRAGAFECGDESPLPSEWVCDSQADCADGADEQDCEELDNAFTCDDGERVPELYRCDSEPDCPDGSDERDCGDRVLSCGDGDQLYPADFRCDGRNHCQNGADELGCPPIAGFRCD